MSFVDHTYEIVPAGGAPVPHRPRMWPLTRSHARLYRAPPPGLEIARVPFPALETPVEELAEARRVGILERLFAAGADRKPARPRSAPDPPVAITIYRWVSRSRSARRQRLALPSQFRTTGHHHLAAELAKPHPLPHLSLRPASLSLCPRLLA